VVFCRRATGPPTVASPNLVTFSSPRGGYPALVRDRPTGSWWPSRQSILTVLQISMRLSVSVPPPLQNTSYRRCFSFVFLQRLCTNGATWKLLRHPNVVNFLGFGSDSPPFSLVYPWMSNGNLSDYVHKHPDVDKLCLVCDHPWHGRQPFERS